MYPWMDPSSSYGAPYSYPPGPVNPQPRAHPQQQPKPSVIKTWLPDPAFESFPGAYPVHRRPITIVKEKEYKRQGKAEGIRGVFAIEESENEAAFALKEISVKKGLQSNSNEDVSIETLQHALNEKVGVVVLVPKLSELIIYTANENKGPLAAQKGQLTVFCKDAEFQESLIETMQDVVLCHIETSREFDIRNSALVVENDALKEGNERLRMELDRVMERTEGLEKRMRELMREDSATEEAVKEGNERLTMDLARAMERTEGLERRLTMELARAMEKTEGLEKRVRELVREDIATEVVKEGNERLTMELARAMERTQELEKRVRELVHEDTATEAVVEEKCFDVASNLTENLLKEGLVAHVDPRPPMVNIFDSKKVRK
ncbi:hypothetical protein HDU98_008356 [Podochytrium sp. JEL0797]|nr:hypothetical protein HDU98_008356 [Podochytrium sp. JEL0797]